MRPSTSASIEAAGRLPQGTETIAAVSILHQLDECHAVLGHRGFLWLQVRLRNFTLQPIDPMATSPIPSRLEPLGLDDARINIASVDLTPCGALPGGAFAAADASKSGLDVLSGHASGITRNERIGDTTYPNCIHQQEKGYGVNRNPLKSLGGQCRIRTYGLWLRRPTLYPTELIARGAMYLRGRP